MLGKKQDLILKYDEILLLEPIGNHSRGTKFLNRNYLISPHLEKVFTEVAKQIPGFNYGRFDLRAPSLEDFLKGEGIKILELNGVNAEPAHIYDPSTKLLTGLKTLLQHWQIIYQISKQNIRSGIQPIKFKEALNFYRIWKIIK